MKSLFAAGSFAVLILSGCVETRAPISTVAAPPPADGEM